VGAGDTLSFRWNFLTNEPAGGLDDFSFFSVGGTLYLLGDIVTASSALPPASEFARQTGYALVQIAFASATTFILGFGVADEGAPSIDSALLIDDVRIANFRVPEPATFVLLVLAFAVAAITRRR
jgi:hypothetical protein